MLSRPMRFPVAALVAAAGALVAASVSASSTPPAIQVIDDATLQAMATTIGGASPLNTTNTVQHWFGTSLDPHNGVTYGYNMAGADPSTNSSATIEADITPVNVNIGGRSFNGTDVLAATLASPQFYNNDYGSTPAATVKGVAGVTSNVRGPGGALSQGDA